MISKKSVKILSVVFGVILVVLWFGGNLKMYLYCQQFLAAHSGIRLNSIPERLHIKEADMDSEKIYLMGFELKFPFYKEDIKNVMIDFVGHRLWNVSIFFKNNSHISFHNYFEITEEMRSELADRLEDSGEDTEEDEEEESLIDNILWNIVETEETMADSIKAAEYATLTDFSWWNLLHNLRLTTLLTLKSMSIPGAEVKSYELETPYLRGIFKKTELKSKMKSAIIYWDWDDESYSFDVFDIDGRIIREAQNIISTIQRERDKEKSYRIMEALYQSKEETKYPRELILLSMISLKGATQDNLKDFLKIMKEKNSPFKYSMEGIQKEVEYLENN